MFCLPFHIFKILHLCACTKWFKFKVLLIFSLFFTFIEPKGYLFIYLFFENPNLVAKFYSMEKGKNYIRSRVTRGATFIERIKSICIYLAFPQIDPNTSTHHIIYYTIKYKLNPIIRGVNILFNCHVIALSGFFFSFLLISWSDDKKTIIRSGYHILKFETPSNIIFNCHVCCLINIFL